MVGEAMGLLTTAIAHVVYWFDLLLTKLDGVGIYVAIISVLLVVRIFVAPWVGAYMNAGASDMVASAKAHRKHWGKFEKNNRGRYLRKD